MRPKAAVAAAVSVVARENDHRVLNQLEMDVDERNDNLSSIESRTENIQNNALKLRTNASLLKKKYWEKNIKLMIMISVSISILLIMIIVWTV